MEIKMFILKNYNCGQQSMGNEVLSYARNFEAATVAETLNSSNYSPGDLIGWRDTPITEIDIRTFNPFRFSSEYHDDELNLIYYNYRHYDPATGRFLSRDPIEEQGGTNLYNFTTNNPINFIDLLGEDRYLGFNRFFPHMGIFIDIWECNEDTNNKWEATDQRTFYFGPSRDKGLGLYSDKESTEIKWPGNVDITRGINLLNNRFLRYTIHRSNRIQDDALLIYLIEQYENPPNFSAWFNCVTWAFIALTVGMEL